MSQNEVRPLRLLFLSSFCLFLFFLPPPKGLSPEAWKLFSIFLFTITGIIFKAAPMGTMSIFGIALTAFSNVVAQGNPKKCIEIAISGFGNSTIWLIVISFFISRGFIKTGLGTRIAYLFIKWFGHSPLGIAYALNAADLLLAPAIPSNTARGGGIIYPVMKSICLVFDSKPENPESHKQMGSYLTLTTYNGDLITSAMFLTATAGNLLAQKFAQDLGISLTWGLWALAASVPCLVSLIIMPWFLYRFYPPRIKETREAQRIASKKLDALGPLQRNEWLMLVCFFLLLILWIFGESIGVEATATGFIGLSFLLCFSVLTWEDIKNEKGAWDTLIWFSALVMLGGQLNSSGFIPWLTQCLFHQLSHLHWTIAFPLIVVSYCYSHYFFASATAHLAAMYTAFLSLGLALGVPGTLLALVLAIMTALMGTQTHYGHGPAPVYYGSGFVDIKEWWRFGFFISIIFIVITMGVGGIWWKIIGVF